MRMTHFFKTLSHWLMPSTCVLCHHPSNRAQDLCEPCHRELPILTYNCPRCARELSQSSLCGNCLQSPPPFDATYALFSYQNIIQRLILNLKFNEALINARILGELFCEKLLTENIELPEIIIPMPLHAKRLKERGFNQALEIVRPIAKQLFLPIDTRSCQRVKHTLAQATLAAEKREDNIKSAFKVSHTIANRHIAIVDDVITTGLTISELAKSCRLAGARRIDVWCIARTLMSS